MESVKVRNQQELEQVIRQNRDFTLGTDWGSIDDPRVVLKRKYSGTIKIEESVLATVIISVHSGCTPKVYVSGSSRCEIVTHGNSATILRVFDSALVSVNTRQVSFVSVFSTDNSSILVEGTHRSSVQVNATGDTALGVTLRKRSKAAVVVDATNFAKIGTFDDTHLSVVSGDKSMVTVTARDRSLVVVDSDSEQVPFVSHTPGVTVHADSHVVVLEEELVLSH